MNQEDISKEKKTPIKTGSDIFPAGLKNYKKAIFCFLEVPDKKTHHLINFAAFMRVISISKKAPFP